MIGELVPALAQFLGAYFHQDWDLDDPDAKAVVHRYLTGESHSAVQQTINEIDRLLEMTSDDKQLRDILVYDLSCYYDPSFEEISNVEWLHWLQKSLKNGIEGEVPSSG
ncbi:contact-dependent growth inhibition system immunity protein [Coleofasciculus sp. H7-2]|uniref:contact-dependent growth inhibition system immunity protein n=1 Tax=Coleofasciculus sp. H7-2 TaxID=3351545 RepID=UPI00366EC7B2